MNKTLDDVVQELIPDYPPLTEEPLARSIYDWIVGNIKYDYGKESRPHQPEDTIRKGKGVCTDMAWLYVKLAEPLGFKARYAYVDIDQAGNQVRHACAIVEIDGKQVQVDPAYRVFDARHLSYKITHPEVLPQENITSDQQIHEHINQSPYSAPFSFTKWTPQQAMQTIILGIACMAAGIGCGYLFEHEKNKQIKYHQEEERFTTKHGEVTFAVEPSAKHLWSEALFYREASEGQLYSRQILDSFIKADKDGNNYLSEQEVRRARDEARKTYLND